jgi:endonuclease IV
MTVDFFDDMMPMPWDQKMLCQFMKINAETGVRRIYWIYHGNREDGFWENTGTPWSKNYTDTFELIGNPYLRAAVKEAHRANMEIFAIYKPFDLVPHFFPSKEKLCNGNLPVVGGKLNAARNFIVDNRKLLMQRRCIEKIPAAKIILKTEDKLSADHAFRLWGSDDNWSYRPIKHIVYPESDGANVIFDVSGETANFFAIESLSKNKVANRLDSIIEVKSAEGKSLQCTLALVPRKYRTVNQKYHLKHEFDIGGGFAKEGFYFDYLPGIPSAVSRGEYLKRTFKLSDNDQNVVGISLEVNDCVPGALEPAEPVAVEYWLKMINKTLACGVDGVDIRISNHNSILDWLEYGFNQPVVDTYIKRYGINPRLEPFDREKLRRLRGEFYTAFLEKAAMLVKSSGKKFCLHVPDTAFGSPEQPTMMEIHWDWQNWLEKEIADEVTFKTIYTDNAFSTEGLKLINLCREKEISVSICPFLHAINDLSEYLSKVEDLGIDAFTIYEAATLWKAEKNGFKKLMPSVNEIIENKFKGYNNA